jgi:hypothetical protein
MARDTEVHIGADPLHPDDWRVEYFDDEGGCYVTIFSGPDAKARAFDYGAAMRNRTLKRYGVLPGR